MCACAYHGSDGHSRSQTKYSFFFAVNGLDTSRVQQDAKNPAIQRSQSPTGRPFQTSAQEDFLNATAELCNCDHNSLWLQCHLVARWARRAPVLHRLKRQPLSTDSSVLPREKQKWLVHMTARIRNHQGSSTFKLFPDCNHIQISQKRQKTIGKILPTLGFHVQMHPHASSQLCRHLELNPGNPVPFQTSEVCSYINKIIFKKKKRGQSLKTLKTCNESLLFSFP